MKEIKSTTKKKDKKKSSLSGGKGQKVKILVNQDADARPPVVLSFPGGMPEGARNIPYTIHASEGKKRIKRKISGENSFVTYEGTSEREAANYHRYMVGVYDQDANTIEFKDVGHVFVMRAVPKKQEESADQQDEGMSYLDRKRLLIESFGSKKKQRAVEAALANVVKAENVAGAGALAGLAPAVAAGGGGGGKAGTPGGPGAAARAAMEANRREILPPFNMAATKPSEVYKIKDVLPPELCRAAATHLGEAAFAGGPNDLVEAMVKKFQYVPRFVASTIRSLPSLEDKKHAERARRLVALRHLLALGAAKPRVFAKGLQTHANDMHMPMSVLSTLFERYAARSEGTKGPKFQRTQQLKGKLQLHVLVAALCLGRGRGGGALDLAELREDLALAPDKIAAQAREVGCVVESRRAAAPQGGGGKAGGMTYTATLRVPLQFPEPRKSKK